MNAPVDNDALIAAFREALEILRAETKAARTTVRLDLPARGWSVNTPCAEALAPGMRSMMGDGSIDHRRARSIRWIEKHRRLLIQGDVTADPAMAPPPALIQTFGAKAQIVGPLIGEDDYLVGWLSAHFAEGPRTFTKAQIAAFERARKAVSRIAGLPYAPLKE
jgi:maleate isomerase